MFSVSNVAWRFVALSLCVAAAPLAAGDVVQFALQTDSGERLISLDSTPIDDSAFVPLQTLIEQAGGAFNALPTRLRVDLGGSTAWLRSGEARVHAFSIFSLRHNITEESGVPMIAADDVPDFFLKSFRMVARRMGQPPAPAAATTPAPGAASVSPPVQPPDEPAALEQLGTPPPAAPTAVATIVIDAGHGGDDLGLQAGTLSEKNITLGVAQRLKALLDTAGRLTAVLTRTEDTDPTQSQRSVPGNAPGSLYLSLHLGSSLSPAAQGVAVFYPAPASGTAGSLAKAAAAFLRADRGLAVDGQRLAQSIGATLSASAGVPLRGVVEAPLKMLDGLQVPSVEVELGCVTNPDEAQLLATDEHLAKLAAGLFDGITAYLDGAALTTESTPAAAPAATEN